MHTNTLIIGAGLAGLTAAYHLAKRGVPFLLLEAKSIPGGRWQSETVTIDGVSVPFTTGGELIHSSHTELLSLCRALNVPLTTLINDEEEISFSFYHYQNCIEERDLCAALSPLVAYCEERANWPDDEKLQHHLDSLSVKDVLATLSIPQESVELYTTYLETYLGTPIDKISSMILHYMASPRTKLSRRACGNTVIQGGSGILCKTLAEIFPAQIRYNTTITSVTKTQEGIVASDTNGTQYTAKRCIVTVPPSACETIKLDISKEKKECLRKSFLYGKGQKYIVAIPSAAKMKEPGIHFFYPENAEVWEGESNVDIKTVSVLFAQDGSPEAAHILIHRIYGNECEILHIAYHPWHTDTFAQGTYPCVPVGSTFGVTREWATAHLLQDGEDSIIFAGDTVLDDEGCYYTGYAEGAVRSGFRAAEMTNDKALVK